MRTKLCVILPLTAIAGLAQEPILAPAENPTHRFEEVAEGVYFVSGTGEIYTMSNSMIIVGERDCILVDTHVTPAAARALVTALKSVTEKPIRQVIISHYHFDHAHGNQIFGPDVRSSATSTRGRSSWAMSWRRERLSPSRPPCPNRSPPRSNALRA